MEQRASVSANVTLCRFATVGTHAYGAALPCVRARGAFNNGLIGRFALKHRGFSLVHRGALFGYRCFDGGSSVDLHVRPVTPRITMNAARLHVGVRPVTHGALCGASPFTLDHMPLRHVRARWDCTRICCRAVNVSHAPGCASSSAINRSASRLWRNRRKRAVRLAVRRARFNSSHHCKCKRRKCNPRDVGWHPKTAAAAFKVAVFWTVSLIFRAL